MNRVTTRRMTASVDRNYVAGKGYMIRIADHRDRTVYCWRIDDPQSLFLHELCDVINENAPAIVPPPENKEFPWWAKTIVIVLSYWSAVGIHNGLMVPLFRSMWGLP